MTDDELDCLVAALSSEGFIPPFSAARIGDYLRDGMTAEQRAAGLAALKAADAEVDGENRDALRRALTTAGIIGGGA